MLRYIPTHNFCFLVGNQWVAIYYRLYLKFYLRAQTDFLISDQIPQPALRKSSDLSWLWSYLNLVRERRCDWLTAGRHEAVIYAFSATWRPKSVFTRSIFLTVFILQYVDFLLTFLLILLTFFSFWVNKSYSICEQQILAFITLLRSFFNVNILFSNYCFTMQNLYSENELLKLYR